MKKCLMIAALVGMVAAPVFAGLAPEVATGGSPTPYSVSASPRGAVYAPNDPDHVYDVMPASAAGPDDLLYQLTQNPASGGICNLIKLRPNASGISSAHLILDTRLAVGAMSLSLGFRNEVGSTSVGSWLTTATFGFSARYFFGGIPSAGVFLFNLTFPQAIVTQDNIWVCLQASQAFRVRGGENGGFGFPGTQVNGGPGDAIPSALYIGSGSGIMASSLGVGIGSASLYSPFVIDSPFTTGTRLGNWHMALGGKGIPEPATAALLGFIGLVALRRRKMA